MRTCAFISRPAIGGRVNDADLATRIGIAFTTRPRIAWHDIHVAVRDAIVTLRGDVPSIYDRRLVVAVTRHVAGVRLVDDQLNIAEPSPATNAPAEPVHAFSNLPVLTESLEDILNGSATSPLAS